ncbi:MAG: ribulose-phosphate 3-epimerase [Candidatus Eisenbacteria bacterium]
MIKIAPSVLSADFSRLAEQLAVVERGGADLIHVDIMDGRFVPNITFGPIIVNAVRKLTKLPLSVHLMMSEPWKYVDAFCDAGADYLSCHCEAFLRSGWPGEGPSAAAGSGTSLGLSADAPLNRELLDSTIARTRERGVTAGLAINPGTSPSLIVPFLEKVGLVVVMSVHPGFGGQGFIREVLPKIEEISRRRAGHDFEVEVDGGVNLETGPEIAGAGATILAAGSYVFRSGDPGEAIRALRAAADSTHSSGKNHDV